MNQTNRIQFFLFGCAVSLALASSAPLHAQEIKFASQDGPYYVGEPVLVQISASGFSEADEIDCIYDGDLIKGISISEPQLSTSSRNLTSIINGRYSHSQSVDYRFNFVATATREGEFSIGPFTVIRNGMPHTIAGSRFRFTKLEPDPNMEISFSLERDTLYVGEKIPLHIRWAFKGTIEDVQYPFSNLQIRSPLFDQFSFSPNRRQTRTSLTLATAKGNIEIDAAVTRERKNGAEFIVVTCSRIMTADTSGTFDSIAISCRTKKVTQWGRNLLGATVARASKPALSAGQPISFTVKPIPTQGRPVSFAGAVGQGFSIDVTANRSVVRVGDPISLTINIKGDGNIELISLPELANQMGMPVDDFQVPEERLSGTADANTKQFNVNIRAKHQEIQQIPALAFSWFDPASESFCTTESKPIALQVMETNIVSASDVIAAPQAGGPENTPRRPNETSNESLSFDGANLAIEKNSSLLIAHSNPNSLTKYISLFIYALAIFGGAFAFIRSRRTDEVIRQNKAKSRVAQIRKTVLAARKQNGKQAFTSIATTLREFIREREPTNRQNIEQLIAECDNAIYSQSDAADESVIERIVSTSLTEIDLASKET